MAEAISDPGDSDEHFDYHYVAKASLGIKDAPRGTGLETYLERNRSSDYDSKSYEDQQAEDKKISKEWEEKNDEDIDGNVIGLMAAGMFWPNDETSDAAMYALGARTTMSGSMKFGIPSPSRSPSTMSVYAGVPCAPCAPGPCPSELTRAASHVT